MKKSVLATVAMLLIACIPACGNHDDSVFFYARFTINGNAYSLEKGFAGTGADGLPAGNTVSSPGMEMFQILASRSAWSATNTATVTNGFLSVEINSDCTNTGTNANVIYRYRHPGKDGVYLATDQTVVITEFGPAGAGVAAGTFHITVSNQTLLEELTLESGTFRVRRIAADTLPTSF